MVLARLVVFLQEENLWHKEHLLLRTAGHERTGTATAGRIGGERQGHVTHREAYTSSIILESCLRKQGVSTAIYTVPAWKSDKVALAVFLGALPAPGAGLCVGAVLAGGPGGSRLLVIATRLRCPPAG